MRHCTHRILKYKTLEYIKPKALFLGHYLEEGDHFVWKLQFGGLGQHGLAEVGVKYLVAPHWPKLHRQPGS